MSEKRPDARTYCMSVGLYVSAQLNRVNACGRLVLFSE